MKYSLWVQFYYSSKHWTIAMLYKIKMNLSPRFLYQNSSLQCWLLRYPVQFIHLLPWSWCALKLHQSIAGRKFHTYHFRQVKGQGLTTVEQLLISTTKHRQAWKWLQVRSAVIYTNYISPYRSIPLPPDSGICVFEHCSLVSLLICSVQHWKQIYIHTFI